MAFPLDALAGEHGDALHPGERLEHYHELRPFPGARGLNSTEAMLIIHLLDHQEEEEPPTIGWFAQRLGLTPRAVRLALKNIEANGYIRRESRKGRANGYSLEGLFRAIGHVIVDKAGAAA